MSKGRYISEDFVKTIVDDCVKRITEGQYDDEEKMKQKIAAMAQHEAEREASREWGSDRVLKDMKRKVEAARPRHQWGKLNAHVFEVGHSVFTPNTRPGTFEGETIRIPTMEKQKVVYPKRDEKGQIMIDPKTGNVVMARGFKDVKSIIVKGIFSGPIYTVRFKLNDKPELGTITHLTTDHRIYGHKAFLKTRKKIDEGVWIKTEVAEKLRRGRRSSIDIKIKLLAVELGMIEDYQYSIIDRRVKEILKLDVETPNYSKKIPSVPSIPVKTRQPKPQFDRGGVRNDPNARQVSPIIRQSKPVVPEPVVRKQVKKKVRRRRPSINITPGTKVKPISKSWDIPDDD
tara:strand:+ start:3710 stop:4741 length:1032 start_codon:yes stop_codon:yes gene_type:complete